MKYDEIWGIAFDRVQSFFSAQKDVRILDNKTFKYIDADIFLHPLPERQLGSICIAQTRVVINGGKAADDIHRRFYMRFLSAGG